MRKVLGGLIAITSILGGIYIGGWLMFIQPIIEFCKAFDAGTLTGLIIGTTILKCIFAGSVGAIIAYLGTLLGVWIAGW